MVYADMCHATMWATPEEVGERKGVREFGRVKQCILFNTPIKNIYLSLASGTVTPQPTHFEVPDKILGARMGRSMPFRDLAPVALL